MILQEWLKLSVSEQNDLASKWGLARGGENNELANEKELEKIGVGELVAPTPLIKEEINELPKKKVRKLGTAKTVKRGHRK